ncbi:uncharacterized protein LOC133887177 [Phragmites australis]|uniref:uncharacterized protein LOC133887177 n=1 Tax=Phragmites australis TaxID=29695 RepID=UPI002D786D1E|nr:uncharacterized protein LOC133887177 [Phragmites australis]
MVRILSQEDLDILRDLPSLYSLDLHVREAVREKLVITGSTGTDHAVPPFRSLSMFKLTSYAMALVFERGAMRKLQLLSFSFRLRDTKYVHADFDLGFENLTSLKAVDVAIDCHSAFLWEVKAAEAAMRKATNLNLNLPTLDVTRHFEREMQWEENQDNLELETMEEEEELSGIAKIGPWGGNGGRPYDAKTAPRRLKSATICSGTVVDSLSFSYVDRTGKQHIAGPWGGHGGSNHTILLGSSELLKLVEQLVWYQTLL